MEDSEGNPVEEVDDRSGGPSMVPRLLLPVLALLALFLCFVILTVIRSSPSNSSQATPPAVGATATSAGVVSAPDAGGTVVAEMIVDATSTAVAGVSAQATVAPSGASPGDTEALPAVETATIQPVSTPRFIPGSRAPDSTSQHGLPR